MKDEVLGKSLEQATKQWKGLQLTVLLFNITEHSVLYQCIKAVLVSNCICMANNVRLHYGDILPIKLGGVPRH